MRPSDCLTRVGVLKIISSFPELFSTWSPKISEIILIFPTTLKDQKEKAKKGRFTPMKHFSCFMGVKV